MTDVTINQARFLRRYITLAELPVPEVGPLAAISIRADWLEVTDEKTMALRITQQGRAAFWRGVRLHGRDAVMRSAAYEVGTSPGGDLA
ncbi:hypothetical protein [Tanticharoenia sakaeratensis]|uniref:Uncharacterized protein n=1 Tax=Tanticharoenia sakaeratensis NBRC 103193 TaxID=1231623 RepID=A0A0D6MP86_9PROT|nr:hypothetical protein [Tanticharoenia sakaeratensis]GAN55225.1 hypothetical protein Tasa_041_020 [Tanticharoenia sakaeratensis NBRC 103193]GBQ23289.1 hypothetical protein AA103193_2363 [Tanticharoenia sakaeratensis NBRC 103193]